MKPDCVMTQHYRDKDGYGVVRVERYPYFEHRVAFARANGLQLSDIRGKVVRHKCDNPGCVNPAHLELGTHAENQKDKVERNRQAKGSANGRAKLSERDVLEIRELLGKGVSSKNLASRFSVASSLISAIKSRKIWRHL